MIDPRRRARVTLIDCKVSERGAWAGLTYCGERPRIAVLQTSPARPNGALVRILAIIGLLSRGSPVKNAISFRTHRLTGSEPFCQETTENRLSVVKPGRPAGGAERKPVPSWPVLAAQVNRIPVIGLNPQRTTRWGRSGRNQASSPPIELSTAALLNSGGAVTLTSSYVSKRPRPSEFAGADSALVRLIADKWLLEGRSSQ